MCSSASPVCRGATSLLQGKGALGLIATNTVAQGDSREVGLDAMVASGFAITRSIQSRSWPASSANLEYAAIWGTLADVGSNVPRFADDIGVRLISTLLEAAGRVQALPVQLAENKGIVFEGCKLRGTGFIIDPDEAHQWIAVDSRNRDVLHPYLNGEDLNSRPDTSASRWAIDFTGLSEEQAASYRSPYDQVRIAVRPERAALSNQLRDNWWLYERPRIAMRNSIATMTQVLVIAVTSKSVMPVRVSRSHVFSNTVDVFALDGYGDQAVLSSSLHQLWAITYGSTLETRVRYTPSDVFDTFPRPNGSNRLERAGRALEDERRRIMRRRDLGLTKLYNLVNDRGVQDDADVARLRDLHVEIDEATVEAYGWDDLRLDNAFHSYRQAERWTVSPAARVEILDRLLEENLRRASTWQSVGAANRKWKWADGDAHLFD